MNDSAVLGALLPALAEVGRSYCPLVCPPTHASAGDCVSPGSSQDSGSFPLGYLDFIALEASARLVLTEPGGVQEETAVLGVPCLTLRDNTERPVTLTEGTNRLVRRHSDRIVAAALKVIAGPPAPRTPALWDGQAGQCIAATVLAAVRVVLGADLRRRRHERARLVRRPYVIPRTVRIEIPAARSVPPSLNYRLCSDSI